MTSPTTSRVIKQPSNVEPAFEPSRVVKSTAQTAEQLLADAREQAAKLISDARERATAIESDAIQRAGENADAALVTLEALVRHERSAFAKSVYEAAASVAATVVGNAVDRDAQPLVDLIHRVAQHAERYRTLQITLHPQDALAVAPFADRIRQALPFADAVTIESDPELRRGDVVIHTEMGRYEGGLGLVLRSLQQALAGRGNA